MSSIYSPLGEYQHGFFGRWTLIPVTKYVPPTDPVSIAGIQAGTAVLFVAAYNSALAYVTMTQTIFDTTTRADSARILVTNSTGAAAVIRGAGIRAKAYTKLAGSEGYLHDKFVDYESIAKNGEQKFELGNDMVVTTTQVNDLADYHWKDKATKRHIYAFTLTGVQTFFEPGEWYTLTIGGAGEQEYISSVCICYGVRARLSATGLGQTAVAFREVYQNWVFDSNEVARSIASGKYGRLPSAEAITVIGSDVVAPGDFYCDGTADETELIAAAIAATGIQSKRLKLVGTFTLSATFTLSNLDNLSIDASSATFEATSITVLEAFACPKLTIFGLHIQGTTCTYGLNLLGCISSQISGNFIAGCQYPIHLFACDDGQIIGNTLDGTGTTANPIWGLYVESGARNLVGNNIILSLHSTGSAYGILITSAQNRVTNNSIKSVLGDVDDVVYGIIISDADDCMVHNNRVEQAAAAGTGSSAVGFYIAPGSDRTQLAANTAYFNGKNLIDHANCESATPPALYGESSVSKTSSLFALDSTVAHGGTYSYKFTKQSVTANTCAVYLQDNVLTNDLHGLLTAHTYTFASWLYMTTAQMVGTNVQMTVDYSSGGAFTTNVATASSTTGSWQTVTETVAIPATMTAVRIGFSVKAASTASSLFCNIDDVEIYDNDPITNVYGRQFLDSGASSMVNINSWQ